MAQINISADKTIVGKSRRKFICQTFFAGIVYVIPKNYQAMLDPKGTIVKTSVFPFGKSIIRLLEILKSRGIIIYADIDQQTELSSVGKIIPPMRLIIFGNPRTGSLILPELPVAGLDLPLKLLIWESTDKVVRIAFNSSDYLATRYNLNQEVEKLLDLEGLVMSAVNN